MNSSQLTYIQQLYNSPKAKTIGLRYGFYLLSALLMFIGCLVTAARIPAPEERQPLSPWREIEFEASAQPLHAPTLLSNAVIWQAFGDTTLRYQHFSGAPDYRYDWIPGQVVEWDAIERRRDILLTWRNSENRLSFATLTLAGEQITAPIPLGAADDFQLVGDDLILWRDSGTLYAVTIDGLGRPTFPAVLREQVGLYAAHPSGRLIWQAGNTLFTGDLDGVTLTSANRLLNWEESPSELHLLESSAGTIAIWGTAVQPDITRYRALVFAGESPEPFDLTLPDNSPLRWLYTDQEQITAAALIQGQWQAVILDIGAVGIENYTVIEGLPVTGSPVAADQSHLGWITLNESLMPQLQLVTQDSRYGNFVYPFQDWRAAMREGLKYAPYGLLWLIAPLLSLLLIKFPPYRVPVVITLYWLSKNLLSFGMFNVPSLVLADTTLTPFVALMGIALFAAIMGGVGWIKTPAWIRYTVFCLTDALLTFAIFGAGVQSLRL